MENMDYDLPDRDSRKLVIKKTSMYALVVVFLVVTVVACIVTAMLTASHTKDREQAKYNKLNEELSKIATTATVSTTVLTTQAPCNEIWCSVRLPQSVIPYHYNLLLIVQPPKLPYQGLQEIHFNVTSPTDFILFHIKEMTVTSVNVSKIDSTDTFHVRKMFPYPENEFYVVQLKSQLIVGSYKMQIYFNATISTILTGFYKSDYNEKDGSEKVLFTTKFQPTDARKAFPCLDEPALKATFTIEIQHPSYYHARSNMPGVTTPIVLDSQMVSTKFDKTVVMSTYLVCFIVSQFAKKYSGLSGERKNVKIEVWSRPEYVNSTEYALNASVRMVTFLEEFLGVPYPMPKLDMFAIPDYGSGATEHWGIVTYRETRLLYTPEVSPTSSRMGPAGIIGHECAHLWFGNLVTCKWWNDLWVQEGMASYLEYYTQNDLHPEWNMMDMFLSIDWKTGMSLDALASSHPISQTVDHPRQIKEIFDSITYNKGSSLFEMLRHYLGLEKFRAALKEYLLKNQYRGATAEDLWNAFSKVSGININEMMDTWTKQMGFPVVTISKTQTNTFQLTQKHFLIDPRAVIDQPSPYKYEWVIPFTYATSANLSHPKSMLIKSKTATITSTHSWLLGNYHHRGFYRVNYDQTGWDEIIKQLNTDHKVFSVTDRAGIIDDAFNLARSGNLKYSVAFDLLIFVEKDENMMVWKLMLSNLEYIGKVLSSTNIYSTYRTYIAKKIQPVLGNGSFLSYALSVGEDSSVSMVTKIFKDWVQNGTVISSSIRSLALYYGLANTADAEWDFVFDKFQNTTNPTERSTLQRALSGTRKPWILKKWLDYSIDGSTVRSQDAVYVISAVASNPVGKYVAWDFAVENWDKIMAIARENNFHVNHFISGLTSKFTTPYELKEVQKQWAKYAHDKDGVNARKQSEEKIKADIYWLEHNYDEVSKWLMGNI